MGAGQSALRTRLVSTFSSEKHTSCLFLKTWILGSSHCDVISEIITQAINVDHHGHFFPQINLLRSLYGHCCGHLRHEPHFSHTLTPQSLALGFPLGSRRGWEDLWEGRRELGTASPQLPMARCLRITYSCWQPSTLVLEVISFPRI